MLGAWCLVLGAWCLVLGAWCLVLGAWFLVLPLRPKVYATSATKPTPIHLDKALGLQIDTCKQLPRYFTRSGPVVRAVEASRELSLLCGQATIVDVAARLILAISAA